MHCEKNNKGKKQVESESEEILEVKSKINKVMPNEQKFSATKSKAYEEVKEVNKIPKDVKENKSQMKHTALKNSKNENWILIKKI